MSYTFHDSLDDNANEQAVVAPSEEEREVPSGPTREEQQENLRAQQEQAREKVWAAAKEQGQLPLSEEEAVAAAERDGVRPDQVAEADAEAQVNDDIEKGIPPENDEIQRQRAEANTVAAQQQQQGIPPNETVTADAQTADTTDTGAAASEVTPEQQAEREAEAAANQAKAAEEHKADAERKQAEAEEKAKAEKKTEAHRRKQTPKE